MQLTLGVIYKFEISGCFIGSYIWFQVVSICKIEEEIGG